MSTEIEPKRSSLLKWAILVVALTVIWAVRSGRLVISSPDIHLSNFTIPSGGPRAEVHPEVLNLQESFARVAELVKPAVVSISTTHIEKMPAGGPQFYFGDPFEEFFQQFFGGQGNPEAPQMPQMPRQKPNPREFKMEGVGSGVIIDPEGLVLTNEHVVRDADQIKVTVYDKNGDKKDYTGRVVGKDARTDIAVVRIRAGHTLPYAALGDSDKVRVGDWAIAIGSPFNLAQTLTVGVISADRQSLQIEGKEYRNLIQTDAAINRGNSGGPLLNIRGEVVGINTAIYAPTGVFAGIGFAVPINQAKEILEDLVHKGHVVRGWLGVELSKEIDPAMVRAFGLPDTKGALVNDVLKNSPAAKAGLKRGDVIRTFNGQAIESSDKLQNLVALTPPNKSVPVEIIRAKNKLNLTLVLGERPESADTAQGEETETPEKSPSKSEQKEWQGAKIVPFTPDLADSMHQPSDAQGVLVFDVTPGSVADDIGLTQGDLIRAVNQTPTPDMATFRKVSANASVSEGIVLDILRQGHPIYLSYSKK
jgi:serine protease Do